MKKGDEKGSPKKILYLSAGAIHPSIVSRHRVRHILEAESGMAVEDACGVEKAARLEGGGYCAVVVYLHRQRISPGALDVIDRFVREGGGMLALHSAAASFKTTPRWAGILGGGFIGHGPVREYTVRPSDPRKETFFGTVPFAVRDELYRHAYANDVEVRYYTDVDGVNEPVAWTRVHGKGRVCYIALGHRADVFALGPVRQVLAQGLDWITGGATS
jgi:uncharacterized protein